MVQKLCGAAVQMKNKIKLMVKTCDFITRIKAVNGFVVLFVIKRSSYFFLLLSLFGCNRHLPIHKVVSIDPILQPYVNEFVQAAAANGHPVTIDNLSMHFVNTLPATTNGECYMMAEGNDGTPLIYINANTWPSWSEALRKGITFHEMGHCILWLEHDTTMIITSRSDFIPRSIMYPYSLNDYIYLTYWNYYMNELFNGLNVTTP